MIAVEVEGDQYVTDGGTLAKSRADKGDRAECHL